MPVTANQVTIAQKHEPEANCDLVTSITVNPGATFDLSTPVGQNDNRMAVGEVRTYVVGTSNTLESVAGAIEVRASSVGSTELAAGAVTTPAIADNNVTQAKLAPLCVGTPELIDANVTQPKMASDSVATSALVDANVTLAKLATEVTDRFITTEQQDKLTDTVWVTDSQFAGGADPTGVADSSAAIQAAVDYVAGTLENGTVVFPKGIYLVNTTINLPRDTTSSNRKIIIDFNGSVIQVSGDVTIFQSQATSVTDAKGITINARHGHFEQTGVALNGTVFDMKIVPLLKLEHCTAKDMKHFARLVFCLRHHFESIDCVDCSQPYVILSGDGELTGGSVTNSNSNVGTYINCRAHVTDQANGVGFTLSCSANIHLINCVVEGNACRAGVRIVGNQGGGRHSLNDIRITNLWSENQSIGDALIEVEEVEKSSLMFQVRSARWLGTSPLFLKLIGTTQRNTIKIHDTAMFNENNSVQPWFDGNILANANQTNYWQFENCILPAETRFSDANRWAVGANGQVPPDPFLKEDGCFSYNDTQVYDTRTFIVPNTILANADTANSQNAKGVRITDLPAVAAAPGIEALVQAPTGLSKTDLSTITATSRKNGVDVVPFANALSIDFDAGSYDNKEVVLTGDIVDITLTATRQTDYELRFRQDATGFRDVFAVTTNISPNIKQVLLAPDSNQVSVWRLYYDGTTFHWG